ncbi:MAG: Crp/Fnr family transcriptional regulator [Candidatus Lambdaproteobacteria bacterium]|nr:Crp/Fnr family transcriptional regulator [Candidatus Lambdaproteobacteria bacterium]
MWNANGLHADLERLASVRQLARDEYLFRQGEAVTALFEVLEGRLRLVRRTIDDHLVVLHTARTGDLFTESSLFAEVYHCDAVTTVPSRVRVYPKDEFIATLRRAPGAWEDFSARLAHQLQALRTRMELRNIRSARERVLQYLRLHVGARERTLRIEGNLQDVAADLGLTREAFYRTLAKLEAEGVLSRTREAIVLNRFPAT